jgi:hydroxymethylbilane synthase
MKDVPGELPRGLTVGAICERASPFDAFVSNKAENLDSLPDGAVIGSSSLRRVLQIQRAYPMLKFEELRGNVDTRLRKLDEGHYDAIILAVAGLERLGLGTRIKESISSKISIPAAGQGAVGIECRQDDARIAGFLAAINHAPTYRSVSAERTVTKLLGATCNLPIAVFAEPDGDAISISAFIANVEGTEIIMHKCSGDAGSAEQLATELGELLLEQGARRLIQTGT